MPPTPFDRKRQPPKPRQKIKGAGNVSAVQAVTGVKQRDPAHPYTPTAQEQAVQNTQTKRTLSRQRLLKAAGYNVVVDGIWGPKSQKAWDDYKQHPRGPFIPAQQVQAQESAAVRQETRRVEAIQAQAAKAKALAQERARVKAIQVQKAKVKKETERQVKLSTAVEVAKQRRAVIHQGQLLLANPTAARAMTLRQVSAVIDDPTFKYDPVKNEAHAKIVQNWLVGHGRLAATQITGKYDVATHDALESAWKESIRQERATKVQSITAQLYAPGVLHPGARPDWWPLDTPIPKPGELLDILSKNTFESNMLVTALQRELTKPQAGFERWRKAQLIALSKQIQPNGLTLAGIFGPEAMSDFQLYNNLLLGSSFSGIGARFGADGLTTGDTRTKWQKDSDTKKLDQLRAHLNSLTLATDVKDFQRRQTAELFRIETEKIKEQEHKSSTWAKFLGSTVEYALAPGEFMRTALVADVHGALDAAHGDFSYIFGNEEQRAAHWEYAQQSLDSFKSRHGVWGFTYDVLADPINLLGPVRTASWIARSTLYATKFRPAESLASKLGGYTLKGAEEGVKGKLVAHVSYEGAAWPAGLRALTARGVGKVPVVGEPILDFGTRLTRSKHEMLASVTHRLNTAARNHFGDTLLGDKILKGRGPRAETMTALKDSTPQTIEHIHKRMEADPVFRGHIQELIDTDTSIYQSYDRGSNLTNVGASLLASYAEVTRAQLTQRMVSNAVKKVIADGEEAGLPAFTVERQALEAAEQIIQGSGSFVAGSIDRNLTVFDSEVNKIVEDGTRGMIDQFENVYLPALQDVLQNASLARGGSLWDNYGKWAHAGNEVATELREVTRQAFDPDRTVKIDNPAWGKRYDGSEAIELREGEISRRQYRVYAHYGRETEAGRQFPEDWLHGELDSIRADVEKHWHKTRGGKWFDDREFLDVPDIYARTHMEAFYIPPKDIPVTEQADPWASYFAEREQWAAQREAEDRQLMARAADNNPDDEWVSGHVKSTTNMDSSELWDHQEALRAERAKSKRDFRPDPRQSARAPSLKTVEDLAGLGDRPLLAGKNKMVEALEQLSWDLGSASSRIPQTIENAISPVTVRAAGKVPGRSHTYSKEEQHAREAAQGFRDHMENHQNLLAQAQDEAIAGELVSELAVWRAFAEAQSRPMQRAYKIIQGGLNTWVFSTLVLRPAWAVRNIVDNWSKLWVSGVRDPRAYFLGAKNPGSLISSVFDFGVREMMALTRFLDGLFGGTGRVPDALQKLVDSFWGHSAETLGRIFKNYDIDIPEHLLEGMRMDPWQEFKIKKRIKRVEPGTGEVAEEEATLYSKLREGYEHVKDGKDWMREALFELAGNRPENYFRRVLYRDEFAKVRKQALRDHLNEAQADRFAHERALKKVNDTLFDYSDVTVIEDNLRVFFPFIQFWQKNVRFWATSALEKPWLAPGLVKYDQTVDEAHDDRPEWMRRYFDTSDLTDVAATIPGGEWVAKALIPGGAQYDPLNMTSFGQLWRFFKSDNANLAPDKQGMFFFGHLIDSFNNTGLGMNPVARKFLENVGVANTRSWQTIFPQTSIASALTRKFFGDNWAGRVMDSERIFTLFMGKAPSDQIAENFNFYVQQEMADQALRGEPVSRKAAEQDIRDWFLTQNALGYFVGTFYRRATPQDIYLSQLNEAVFDGKKLLNTPKGAPHFYNGERVFAVTEAEKKALNLWWQKGGDELSFDRYVSAYPLIQAYYANGDYDAGQRMLMEHPQIVPYLSRFYAPFKDSFIQQARLKVQGSDFFFMDALAKSLDLPYELRKAATAALLTPELEASWHKNDTPAETRKRNIQGEVFRYYENLNNAYHDIPETDYAAKDDFLNSHPELVQQWGRNNSPADDYEGIIGSTNAVLRETYFATQREHGWDAANAFLKQYPFMFEGTKSEDKINQETGEWKATSKYARAYMAARDELSWFFDKYMPAVGKKAAFDWLYANSGERAKTIRDFLALARAHNGTKGGTGWSRAHHLAFLVAKPWLDLYFGMDKKARDEWLRGDSEGAKIIRDYFDKYSSAKGQTQHSKDYLAIKPLMDRYFAMTKVARRAFLDGKSADAQTLLAYFKKYGKHHQFEKAFKKLHGPLVGGTPDQKLRLSFWVKYFQLPPDERPAFVQKEAENHGIFIYGVWGQQERHDRELAYMRTVIGQGITKRQAAYLYVKPLIDFFHTVPKDQKALFLRANPELQRYFNLYVHTSLTGNKKLDVQVKAYFDLPENSDARSVFLRKHPEVQKFFDAKATPAERAIRAVVTAYFNIENRDEKQTFLEKHPEIQNYFDSRRQIKDNEKLQLDAFDHSDPRYAPFFNFGDQSILDQAARMRLILREQAMNKHRPKTIENRRDGRRVLEGDAPAVRQTP